MANYRYNMAAQAAHGPILFNRIFIGGGLGLTEEQWRENFSPFGPIKEVFIMKDRNQQDQGNVFIEFEKTSQALKAMAEMDGQPTYHSPRILRIELAKERNRKDAVEINYDHADDKNFLERIFFICDKTKSSQALREYFGRFGTVVKLYLALDRTTQQSRGRGWIRYSNQWEAATALEEAGPEYSVDWADVRRPSDSGYGRHGNINETGWAPRGSGGNQIKYDEEGNLDYHSLSGITEEDLDFLPGFEPVDLDKGPDTLEAITPPGMIHEMAKGLFDMAPGMSNFKLDTRTGIARAQYDSPRCAAYAKQKLDNFDYAGMPLQLKFGQMEGVNTLKETAVELKATMDRMLQNGTSDTAGLSSIMQSLKMIQDTLSSQGISVDDKPAKDLPWCSAALPKRKPLASKNTAVVGRLFLVATPEAFYDKILYNVFCRFGDLIRVGFEKDKRFGFAHYASQEAADEAKRTLHGQYIFSSKMKIEYASAPSFDDESKHKKGRFASN